MISCSTYTIFNVMCNTLKSSILITNMNILTSQYDIFKIRRQFFFLFRAVESKEISSGLFALALYNKCDGFLDSGLISLTIIKKMLPARNFFPERTDVHIKLHRLNVLAIRCRAIASFSFFFHTINDISFTTIKFSVVPVLSMLPLLTY